MKNTTPSYTKWMSPDADASSLFLTRQSTTPEPEPFPEYHDSQYRSVGPPSDSSDSMSAGGSFSIPLGEEGVLIYGTCSLFLGVDDWGYMKVEDAFGNTVAEVDLRIDPKKAGIQGGCKYHWAVGGAQLPSGDYTWSVEHTNIDYNPASDNASICNYKIDVIPTEAGGKKKPEPCDCEGDTCNGDGGTPPAPYSLMSLSAKSADEQGGFSSAGCSIQAESTETLMYWSCNFGSFRGLGGIPAGRVELRAEEGIAGLELPTALNYKHPLTSYLEIPEGGIVSGARFDLVEGDRVIAMRCDSNGVDVHTLGVDTQGGGRASMILVAAQSCLQWSVSDGSVYIFSGTTGELLSYTTADKQTISDAGAYLKLKRAADGSLRQIWNLWDGLLEVSSITSTGYRISLYTPSQITGTDASGYYIVTGAPFKSFELTQREETHFTITEKTPQRQDYSVTWWQTGIAWNMQRGEGEEALLTTRTRTELEASIWQLVTEKSKGEQSGSIASRICEVYQSAAVGELLLSHVNGYGSEDAQTSQYTYDQCGRMQTETSPDGSIRSWMYDEYGRSMSSDEPWAAQGRRKTLTTYANSTATNFNSDPAMESSILVPLEGKEVILSTTSYKYTHANHIKRTEKRITGLGVTGTRLSIDEQWQATAANPYARGRSRMMEASDGIQTWYDYAATTQHGALYTETEETRIRSIAVPGRSTRKTTYISAAGQRLREESYALLSNNQWALTETADYSFDTQNRWVKKTRGNGRITERALMCDGGSLWEKDEDGVRTQHAYDSARQRIESIRSEILDGDTVITPETIHSYSVDAQGQTLQTRIDIGAMSTTESTLYDLLGRTLSTTDTMGRVTSYAYSADGLTSTVTQPSGATRITTMNPDGTEMESSGTGVRHTRSYTSIVNDGILTVLKAFSENAETEVQRTVVNGIGESLRVGTPNSLGGTIFDRRSYNAKGQLVKTLRDTGSGSGAIAMAPTLYEYDAFGNKIKETLPLESSPTIANSRITEWAYALESAADGIYRSITTTQNNGQGTNYTSTSKQLISESPSLESKNISIDPRGKQSLQWTQYAGSSIRETRTSIESSSCIALRRSVDGWETNSSDFAGVTTSATRAYTATGMSITATDARQNSTITKTDLAGRTISVQDAAGNQSSMLYHPHFDLPALITNALGKTSAYQYDIRARKTAEYGSAIQPLLFGYNDADQMISLTSFRASEGDISSDPTDRTDGDTSTWSYHATSQVLLRKSYADGTHEESRYNALNMIASLTDARGIIRSYSYDLKRGVNTAISYSDGTAGIEFSWNLLNQITEIRDASGIRSIAYNQYAESEIDSIHIEGLDYLLSTVRDAYGRSAGYTLSKDTSILDSVAYAYGEEGRLATASFLQGEEKKSFSYSYLAGTNLLQSIAHPNNILMTRSYEEKRDLILTMNATVGEIDLVLRGYSYDELGRPVTRSCSRQGETRNDSFAYNDRSELITASLGVSPYAYAYDNIGNRESAQEAAQELTSYVSNPLNQYTGISQASATPFVPEYDAAGNQTKLQTSTGIWNLAYDANNRPTSFTSEDGQTVIDCDYDYMGRRFMKKITIGESITVHQRYLYRGYLQIAALDLTLSNLPALWFTHWDPTEASATRPLSIRKNETWYSYGQDLTKNVTELYKADGTIASTYDYSPYGAVTATGIEQPLQWSSEVYDTELGMVYYNYRHYNPRDGRWISRDPSGEAASLNLYSYLNNSMGFDWLGLANGGAPGSSQGLLSQFHAANEGSIKGTVTVAITDKATGTKSTYVVDVAGKTTVTLGHGATADGFTLTSSANLVLSGPFKADSSLGISNNNGKVSCCLGGKAQVEVKGYSLIFTGDVRAQGRDFVSTMSLEARLHNLSVEVGVNEKGNSTACAGASVNGIPFLKSAKVNAGITVELRKQGGCNVGYKAGLIMPGGLGTTVEINIFGNMNQKPNVALGWGISKSF